MTLVEKLATFSSNYDRWDYLLHSYSFAKDADPAIVRQLWMVESTEDAYSIDGERVDDLHPATVLTF